MWVFFCLFSVLWIICNNFLLKLFIYLCGHPGLVGSLVSDRFTCLFSLFSLQILFKHYEHSKVSDDTTTVLCTFHIEIWKCAVVLCWFFPHCIAAYLHKNSTESEPRELRKQFCLHIVCSDRQNLFLC